MTKYHISDAGQVVECKAQPGNCPRDNFDSLEEATKFQENLFEKHISTLSKTPANPLRKAEQYYGGQFLTPYHISLSEGVKSVIDDLQKIGNPLIVGGAVRDSFIGADNKDIDIEVHKTDIDSLVKTLKNQGYTVDEVGKQFGVLKVSKKGVIRDLDISVPRKENRLGAGHRSFEVEMDENMSVSEAAERRDFTFNAVMYDAKRELLVDPANGRKDFENKIMRHVSEKFAEDPLRVLRGFQFAGRFDMTMAPETIELSKKLRPEYNHLSTERIQEEWGKFFTKSVKPLNGIKALQETGWDDTENGLKETLNKEETQYGLSNLPNAPKERKVIYGAAVIVSGMDNNNDRKNFLKKSVIGAKEQQQAYNLATFDKTNASSTYERKVMANQLKREGFTFNDFGNYSIMIGDNEGVRLAEEAKLEGIGDKPEPDLIMGKDILELSDKKPGPWMGKLLENIRDKQYRGDFKNKNEALSYAQTKIKID